jgi:hypothetical protein
VTIVDRRLWTVADRVQGGVDRVADVRGQRVGQPVVHPEAVTARVDEAGAPQVREVPGRGGLRDVEAAVDVADAHLTVGEQ